MTDHDPYARAYLMREQGQSLDDTLRGTRQQDHDEIVQGWSDADRDLREQAQLRAARPGRGGSRQCR